MTSDAERTAIRSPDTTTVGAVPASRGRGGGPRGTPGARPVRRSPHQGRRADHGRGHRPGRPPGHAHRRRAGSSPPPRPVTPDPPGCGPRSVGDRNPRGRDPGGAPPRRRAAGVTLLVPPGRPAMPGRRTSCPPTPWTGVDPRPLTTLPLTGGRRDGQHLRYTRRVNSLQTHAVADRARPGERPAQNWRYPLSVVGAEDGRTTSVVSCCSTPTTASSLPDPARVARSSRERPDGDQRRPAPRPTGPRGPRWSVRWR
jgi:hypothetical protein